MNTEFLSSQTRINLMRSFAGESQARNRYTFAQQIALQNNMYIISLVFNITADEEKAHAEVFYNLLNDSNEKDIEITAGYPVNVYNDVQSLLSSSVNNEKNENTIIYPQFAEIATQEGFTKVASKFKLIAEIEDFHRKRFEYYSNLLKNDMLFRSDKTEKWRCLNCGHIHESSEAPLSCPVCSKNQGYFIRIDEAPFIGGGLICQH